jgi:hypothetical protein
VGEYVEFTQGFDPALPVAPQKTVKWTPSGKYVNDYTQLYYLVADDSDEGSHRQYYGSKNYFPNGSLLTNESTHAWWVRDTDANKVSLAENLAFPNGQQAVVVTKGKFEMYCPGFLGIANHPNPHVMIVPGTSFLQVGKGTGAPNDESMHFDALVLSTRRAVISLLQLIDSDSSYDTAQLVWCRTLQGEADNSDPFVAKIHSGNGEFDGPHYFDAPGVEGLYSYANRTDSFKIYVQFTPVASGVGDTGQNIPITLAIVKWNWEGHSFLFSNGWQLTGTDYVSEVDSRDSDEFPRWMYIHSNSDPFHICF